MKNCVNVNSIEFKDLVSESGLDQVTLATKISNWQDVNGVDNYPTLEQLNVPETLANIIPSNINKSTDGTNHINIYSKGQTELGRLLSNFTEYHFKYQEYDFASIEAWWHWYKLSNATMNGLFGNTPIVSDSDLDDLRGLFGLEAYKRGQELVLKYNLKNLSYPPKDLLKSLYEERITSQPSLSALLQKSTLPLYHYYSRPGDNNYQWTADLWNEIRQELKGEAVESSNNSIYFEEEQSIGYRERTIKNASADATIAFVIDFNSAGEKLTKSSVLNQNKKYIPVDLNNSDFINTDKIVDQLNSVNARILNIAGNGIYTFKGQWTQDQIDQYVYDILKDIINNKNLKNKIELVRSGGQTGVDEAGIKAAIRLGIPTLILAPKGWLFRDINGKDIANESLFKARFNINIPSNTETTTQPYPTPSKPTIVRPSYSIEEMKKAFNSYILEGFASGDQQKEAVNTILFYIKSEFFNNNESLKVNEAYDKINKIFNDLLSNYTAHRDYAIDSWSEYTEEELKDFADNHSIFKSEDLTKRVDDIQNIINNFDQLFQRAILKTKFLGLTIKGDLAVQSDNSFIIDPLDEDNIEDAEAVGDDSNYQRVLYNDNARFSKSPISSASFRFKLFLTTIPKHEIVDGKLLVKKNYIGAVSYSDFDRLWKLLAKDLADTYLELGRQDAETGLYTGLLGVLYKKKDVIPEYGTIIDRLLLPENNKIATEFVNSFALTMHNRYSIFDSKTYKDGKYLGHEYRYLDSNYWGGYKSVIQSWWEIQKSLPISKEENGELVIDLDEVHRIRDEWKAFVSEYDTRMKAASSKDRIAQMTFARSPEFKEKFRNTLADLGMRVHSKTIDDIIENSNKIFGADFTNVMRLTDTNGKDITNTFMYYMFNAFEPKEEGDEILEDDGSITKLSINNPIYGARSERAIRKIATYEYENSDSYVTLDTIDGKQHLVYNMSQYTYIANIVRKLKQDDSNYIKLLEKTSFAKDSTLLEALKTNPQFRNAFRINYFDSHRERNRNKEFKMRNEMDDSDQTIDAISAMFNNGSDIGFFFMATHGGNDLAPQIPLVKHKTDLSFTGDEFSINDDTLNTIMKQVMAEVSRIEKFQDQVEVTNIFPNYDVAANYFSLFPYLNPDIMEQLVKDKAITQPEFDEVWNPRTPNDIYYKLQTGEQAIKVIKKIVASNLDTGIKNTINDWINMGIVTDVQGKLSSDLINIKYKDKYNLGSNKTIQSIAADFYINYVIAYSEMYRVIYGDPAIYAKVTEGKTPTIDFASSLAFLQKRLKGSISPHITGRWEFPYYNRITINNRKINIELPEYVSKFGEKAYHNIDSTDGIEYATVEEGLRFKRAFGKITEDQYQDLLKTYNAKKDFSKEQLEVFFSQDKPLSFTSQLYEQYDVMMIDFTKSSTIYLLPQFTKGMQLDILRRLLEDHNIQRASSESADKMGANAILQLWDKEGNISQDFIDNYTTFTDNRDLYVRTLSREDMGMQQEMPQGKTEVLTSTQLDKNLFLYARNLDGFKYKGKSISGKKLEELKEDIKIKLVHLGKDRVFEKMGLSYQANGTFIIKDLNTIRTVLEKEAANRNWSSQDIKGLQLTPDGKQFIVPLFFNNSIARIEALLYSVITNEMIKHHLPGTGYTQAPAGGLNIFTKDEVNLNDYDIRFTESYDIKEGLQGIRSINGIIKPAQVFVTWNFRDNDGNLLDMEDFINEDKTRIDLQKLPKDILEMISLRIPNHGHNTSLPVEIVGFIPRNMGDTIIVPDTITKQMGSDFDIDKLYSYITNYYYNPLTKTINKISSEDEIYKNNTVESLTKTINEASNTLDRISKVKLNLNTLLKDVKFEKVSQEYEVDDLLTLIRRGEAVDNAELQEAMEAVQNMIEDEKDLKEELKDINATVQQLQEARFEAENNLKILNLHTEDALLKQDYKDIHWSVLMHKDMFEHIGKPLDVGDLEAERVLLSGYIPQLINTWSYQMNSYINQKASANQIAPFALQNGFHSVTQNYDIKYKKVDKEGNLIDGAIYFKDDNNNLLKLDTFNGDASSMFINEVPGKDYGKTFKRNTHTNINIQVSASVDAKNLSEVGINEITTPVSNVLTQMQTSTHRGLDFRYNTRFLSQEGIKLYVNLLNSNLRSSNDEYFKGIKEAKYNALNKAKNRLRNKIDNPDFRNTESYRKLYFNPKELLEMAQKNNEGKIKNEDYYIAQYKILEMYEELDFIAEKMISARKAILSVVTNGPGINFDSAFELQQLVDNLPNNITLFGVEKVLGEYEKIAPGRYELTNPTTQYGVAAKETLDIATGLASLLIPMNNSTFNNAMELFTKISGEDELSPKLRRTILKQFKTFMLSGNPELFGITDVRKERFRLLFNTVDSPSTARILEAYQIGKGKDNAAVSRLYAEKATKAFKPDTIIQRVIKGTSILEEETLIHMVDMLTDNDPKVRELAQDLILYSYINGNVNGIGSFNNLALIEYLEETGFNAVLRRYNEMFRRDEIDVLSPTFVYQLFQHFPWYAKQFTFDQIEKTIHSGSIGEKTKVTIPIVFALKDSSKDASKSKSVAIGTTYPLLISHYVESINRWILYENQGKDELGNDVYAIVPTKGQANAKKVKISEYDFTGEMTSLLYENAVPTVTSMIPMSIPRNRIDLQINKHTIEGKSPIEEIQYLKSDVVDDILAEKIEDEINRRTRDGILGFWTSLPVESTIPYYSLLSNIIKRTLVSQKQTDFKLIIDYDLTATASTNFKNSLTTEVRINPLLTLNQFNRNQFENDNDYLTSSLDHQIIHEGMHTSLVPIVYKRDKNSTKVNAILSSLDKLHAKTIEELSKKYPNLTADIEKFKAAKAKADENNLKSSDLNSIESDFAYALSSLDEFMVGLLVNKDLQRELNDIKYTDQTLYEKLINLLNTLFEYLANELGIQINNDSVLYQGISDVIALYNLPILEEENRNTEFSGNLFSITMPGDLESYHRNMIARLNQDVTILKGKYTGNMSKEERYWYAQQIATTERLRNEILDDTSAENIFKVANAHLDYAEFVSTRQLANMREIDQAREITDTWLLNSTKEFMSEEQFDDLENEYRQAFDKVNARATILDNRLSERSREYFKKGINIQRESVDIYTKEDLENLSPENMNKIREGYEVTKDSLKFAHGLNTYESKFLSADKSKDPMAQHISLIAENAKNNQKSKLEALLKESKSAFEKLYKDPRAMSLLGKDFKLIHQVDELGNDTGRMVSEYSDKWYRFRDTIYSKMYAAQAAFQEARTGSNKTALRIAKRAFYTELRSVAIAIDLRFFRRDNHSTKIEGYTFKNAAEYTAWLYKELGEEVAKEKIAEAQAKYDQYLKDAEDHKNLTALNDAITNKEAELKYYWTEYDPLLNLDIRYTNANTSEFQTITSTEKYITLVPRKNIAGKDSGFYDKNYETIMSNDTLREFYLFYTTMLSNMLSLLPSDIVHNTPKNMLPYLHRLLEDNWKEAGMFETLKYMPKEFLNSMLSDEVTLLKYSKSKKHYTTYASGETYKRVPTYFMKAVPKPVFVDGKGYDTTARDEYLNSRSKNLEFGLNAFIDMAVTFQYMNEVQTEIRNGLRIVKEAEEYYLDKEGRPVLDKLSNILGLKKTNDNLYGMIEHNANVLLYNEARAVHKASNVKVRRDWSQKTHKDRVARELFLQSKAEELEEQLRKEEITPEEFEAKIAPFEEEYQRIARKSLVWGSLGDKFVGLTQLKGLALNINSGFANLGFGIISNLTYSNGKVDFDNTSYLKAFRMTFGVLNSKSTVGKKITKLVSKYNILFEVAESRMGETNRIDYKMFGKRLDPYIFQTKTEFFNQASSFIAHMLFTKIQSKNGEINLFEAYDNNGDWRTELFTEEQNEQWKSEVGATVDNAFTRTRNKVIQFNKAIHGNYNPNAPVWIKKYLIGRMLMQFRSWIPEGVESRFGKFYFDNRYGRFREGRYRTYAQLGIGGTLQSLYRQISKSKQAFMHKDGHKFAPWEVENMRRNLAEIGVFASMLAVRLMMMAILNSLDDDDDPNSKAHEKALIYSINILQRVESDIKFYISPSTFTQIINNPLAVMKTYKDFQNAIIGTRKHLTDPNYQGDPSWIQWSKAFPYTNQVPKFMYMTERRLGY